MFEANKSEKAKDILKELIQKMGIEAEIETREQPGMLVFNIRSEDSNILIGQHGVNLAALQYLVRIMAGKSFEERIDFIIDVDEYKKKRQNYLASIAKEICQEVITTKKPALLRPMPAFERRAIHAALSEYEDIETESVGHEPERQVVVYLKGTSLPEINLKEFEKGQDYLLID